MKASLSTGKYPGAGALMIALLVAGCASTEPTRTESSANPIVGTWRLVSLEMEVALVPAARQDQRAGVQHLLAAAVARNDGKAGQR